MSLLKAAAELEVVGEAANGHEALNVADELEPDVVVMDVRMPEMNGIEATRALAISHPEIGVLVLTMFDDPEAVEAAERAGARGYLLKGATQICDLVEAIKAISMR